MIFQQHVVIMDPLNVLPLMNNGVVAFITCLSFAVF